MNYQATIQGTYKTRVYINFIFFKIVRGWRTDNFSWSQTVSAPEIHLAFAPLKNVPIAISLDVTASGADFGVQVLSQNFPIEHISFAGPSQTFHWEPWKGVLLDGTATFSQVTASPAP